MKKVLITILIMTMIGGIILVTMEIVKGHCGDSKCTYDVYTKEKVDELLAAKDNEIEALKTKAALNTEEMNLTFNYKLNKYDDLLKEGTIELPVKFHKSGAMVTFDYLMIGIQATGLKEPVVDLTTYGVPYIEFYVNSDSLPANVDLIHEETDKFKKYTSIGSDKIAQDLEKTAYVEIESPDKLKIHFVTDGAGSVVIQASTYMADNID